MASPNERNSQDTLTPDRNVEIRSPYEIIKKWARHPTFREHHLRGELPYILFTDDVLLVEYSFQDAEDTRYYYRIWEDLKAGGPQPTLFRRDGGTGTTSFGEGKLVKGVSEMFDECKNLYPSHHYVKLNNTRSVGTTSKWWNIKVDDLMKMRSEIAREVFEIVARVDPKGLEKCDQSAKAELDGMVKIPESRLF